MTFLRKKPIPEQLIRLAFHCADDIPCANGRRSNLRPLPCEEHYRLLFADNPNAIWIFDGESLAFLEVNQAACALYGYTREEFLSLTLPDLHSRHSDEETQRILASIDPKKAQAAKVAGVWKHLRKDGTVIDAQITTSAILFEGRPAILVVIHDVSELKRVEKQLHRARMELELRVKERTAEIERSNAKLLKEMSNRQRLEQKILEVSETEQRKLGQDLHDDLGQQLTGMALLASVLAADLHKQSNPLAREAHDLVKYLGEASLSARNLARGLYPITLDRGGFLVALDELATRISKMPGVHCEFKCEESFKLQDVKGIQFYRIIQEGVNNAIKHGKARKIVIECKTVKNKSTVFISNDGKPFREPKATKKGMGLSLMRHRARMIGAHLVIRRGHEGGCEMICSIPKPLPKSLSRGLKPMKGRPLRLKKTAK